MPFQSKGDGSEQKIILFRAFTIFPYYNMLLRQV